MIQIPQTGCMQDKLIISDTCFTLPFAPVIRVPERTLVSHEAYGFSHWRGGTDIMLFYGALEMM